VDPAAVGAVLTAMAAGGGEALSGRAWEELAALVRRPFRRTRPAGDDAAPNGARVPSGEGELAALAQAPADGQRAAALARALTARADADSDFADALQAWYDQARRVPGSGDVSNTISGGTQYGPVLQGRDFTGITFGVPAQPPPPPPGPPREPGA
jgi:hypothetical protein